MLTVEINDRDMERARILAAKYPAELRAAMFKANRDSSSVLLRAIKLKVSGHALKVRTGNLRRGWAQIMPRVADGDNAWVGGAGTNVEYDPYHEFGFSGTEQVKEHTRRSARTRLASAFGPNGKDKFSRRTSKATHKVSAHSRAVNYAGRPHARPALSESRLRIEAIHSDGIRQAWEKSK